MECNYEVKLGNILKDKVTNAMYPIIKINDDNTAVVLGDNYECKTISLVNVEDYYTIVSYTNESLISQVEHPKHYNRKSAMECIEEMEMLFGKEETKIFCKLNAWKYRYRAADKNGEEDLKKSDWYIQKYKELSMPF